MRISAPLDPCSTTRGFLMERVATPPQSEVFDQYTRTYNDMSTWFAEVLNGSMRTPFEYQFDGQELYAEDGSRLGPIFDSAINQAEALADAQPNLAFELRRRYIERAEYEDMLAMGRGELPNTMVVVSDFPAELMDAKEDVGGYNVTRKQTMLRVITADETGLLKMYSQSLDGSDRKALEALYAHAGTQAEEGELLGQRIHVNLVSEEQEFLVDGLMGVYDRSLGMHYGGEWYAGQEVTLATPHINTYDFALQQQDLMTDVVERQLNGTLTNERLYGVVALLEKRYETFRNAPVVAGSNTETMMAAMLLHEPRLDQAIFQAGQEASAEGKVFSGCGSSLAADSGSSSELNASGYGNKSDEETKYSFDKKMYCVVCQAPPKKNASKKLCGPCGICQGCDTAIRAKNK